MLWFSLALWLIYHLFLSIQRHILKLLLIVFMLPVRSGKSFYLSMFLWDFNTQHSYEFWAKIPQLLLEKRGFQIILFPREGGGRRFRSGIPCRAAGHFLRKRQLSQEVFCVHLICKKKISISCAVHTGNWVFQRAFPLIHPCDHPPMWTFNWQQWHQHAWFFFYQSQVWYKEATTVKIWKLSSCSSCADT